MVIVNKIGIRREVAMRKARLLVLICWITCSAYAFAAQEDSILKASPGHTARIYENGRLTSPSGNYVLIMQDDGNLVLYRGECANNPTPSCAVWDSRTHRERGSYYLAMQEDGNLVVYRGRPPDNPSNAIWDSRTFRSLGNYFLAVQDDGNVVIYEGTGMSDNRGAIWSIKPRVSQASTPPKEPILRASPGHNARLYEKGRLTSPSGNYVLIMQEDGNLVLYRGECANNPSPSCAVWDSRTHRERGSYYLAMQEDGNLVVYRGRPPDNPSNAIWDSHTFRSIGNYFLAVQDDGNVVIYEGTGLSDHRGAIWSIRAGRIR
jgi:hypothetical protein